MTIEEKFYKIYQENCIGLNTRDSSACEKCLLTKKAKVKDAYAYCSCFMNYINYKIKCNKMVISDNPIICDCIKYMYNARYNRKSFYNSELIDKARFCCLCVDQFDCKKKINDFDNCEEFALEYGIVEMLNEEERRIFEEDEEQNMKQ